jgi:hypothetical protein
VPCSTFWREARPTSMVRYYTILRQVLQESKSYTTPCRHPPVRQVGTLISSPALHPLGQLQKPPPNLPARQTLKLIASLQYHDSTTYSIQRGGPSIPSSKHNPPPTSPPHATAHDPKATLQCGVIAAVSSQRLTLTAEWSRCITAERELGER